jgi:hypothetical protein
MSRIIEAAGIAVRNRETLSIVKRETDFVMMSSCGRLRARTNAIGAWLIPNGESGVQNAVKMVKIG